MIFFCCFQCKLGEKLDCHNTLQIQHIQAEVLIALSEKVIINLKIDINPKCNPGMTPLHHAAENGHVGTYQLIIKHVEDKNPENVLGLTPLHFAEGHKNFHQIFKTAFSYDFKTRMRCKRPSGS